VTKKRKKHYILNEKEMRQRLFELGLEGTTLDIRDHQGKKPKVELSLTGKKLEEVVEILDELGDRTKILDRRGLGFDILLNNRHEGKLPAYWIVVNGRNLFYHSHEDFLQAVAKYSPQEPEDDSNGNGQAKCNSAGEDDFHEATTASKYAELHEVKEIERLIAKLESRGLSVEDYYIERAESVTGEKAPARYVLVNEDEEHELENISQISGTIRQIGSKGMEIKRFKGLGEMNADQLWETTMDPTRRMLLRIKDDEAEEAERLFTLLMGDNVANRRQYIEEHALEVKNLDI